MSDRKCRRWRKQSVQMGRKICVCLSRCDQVGSTSSASATSRNCHLCARKGFKRAVGKTPSAQKPHFRGKRLRDYVLTPIYEASTFAEKQLKMEELIPVQSASRYRKTIDDYKLRLKDNPDLKLSEFCKEVHTNYRRVLSWTRRHGISISALKRKASGGTAWGLSDTEPGNAFIQFVPSSRLTSASLLGISITFPDGVNLTLQESSVESVISLLTIYQSRQGGAKSCSD